MIDQTCDRLATYGQYIDVIDKHVRSLYAEITETYEKYRYQCEGILSHIDVLLNPGDKEQDVPAHWHYITYGISGVKQIHDSLESTVDGCCNCEKTCSFELTFRLKRSKEETFPQWPLFMLKSFAEYIHHTGNTLNVGDHIPWNKPLDQVDFTADNSTPNQSSKSSQIKHLLVSEDPELMTLNADLCIIQFRQLLGVLEQEVKAAQNWKGCGLLDLCSLIPQAGGPYFVTDMSRELSVFDYQPYFIKLVGTEITAEGSNLAHVTALCSWEGVCSCGVTAQKRNNTTGNLVQECELESVTLYIDNEASELLSIAARGRLSHGKYFMYESPHGEAILLIPPECTEPTVSVTFQNPLKACGSCLQIYCGNDFISQLAEAADTFSVQQKHTMTKEIHLSYPRVKIVISRLVDSPVNASPHCSQLSSGGMNLHAEENRIASIQNESMFHTFGDQDLAVPGIPQQVQHKTSSSVTDIEHRSNVEVVTTVTEEAVQNELKPFVDFLIEPPNNNGTKLRKYTMHSQSPPAVPVRSSSISKDASKAKCKTDPTMNTKHSGTPRIIKDPISSKQVEANSVMDMIHNNHITDALRSRRSQHLTRRNVLPNGHFEAERMPKQEFNIHPISSVSHCSEQSCKRERQSTDLKKSNVGEGSVQSDSFEQRSVLNNQVDNKSKQIQCAQSNTVRNYSLPTTEPCFRGGTANTYSLPRSASNQQPYISHSLPRSFGKSKNHGLLSGGRSSVEEHPLSINEKLISGFSDLKGVSVPNLNRLCLSLSPQQKKVTFQKSFSMKSLMSALPVCVKAPLHPSKIGLTYKGGLGPSEMKNVKNISSSRQTHNARPASISLNDTLLSCTDMEWDHHPITVLNICQTSSHSAQKLSPRKAESESTNRNIESRMKRGKEEEKTVVLRKNDVPEGGSDFMLKSIKQKNSGISVLLDENEEDVISMIYTKKNKSGCERVANGPQQELKHLDVRINDNVKDTSPEQKVQFGYKLTFDINETSSGYTDNSKDGCPTEKPTTPMPQSERVGVQLSKPPSDASALHDNEVTSHTDPEVSIPKPVMRRRRARAGSTRRQPGAMSLIAVATENTD